jgi:hypothetical protein
MNKVFNTFAVRTDIVVIGRNPEMADYSNRDGSIFGYAAYVEASNDYGDTRELFICSSACEAEATEKAETLAQCLTARFESLGKQPVGFAAWREGRAIYGSEAWVEYGNDDELAYERRELADEFAY